MKLGGNTVFITGGASGIGFALASRFVRAGSEVVICGRRESKLKEAKERIPELHVLTCDLASETERRALTGELTRRFPRLNVLINNAGIQNRPPALAVSNEATDWAKHRQEIAINWDAPLHLSMLFLPHLLKQERAAIINVSSGLAFAPLAFMPTYCATKAALHSLTLSLREQLKASPAIEVVEVIPPAVNTDLGGKGLHDWGVPLEEFADYAVHCIEKGQLEFGYGTSETRRNASRAELDEIFRAMNGAPKDS